MIQILGIYDPKVRWLGFKGQLFTINKFGVYHSKLSVSDSNIRCYKHQSREWHTANSPRPKKARMSKSKIKSMFICFFVSQGTVHKEFVPPGQTVNQTFLLGSPS